MGPLQKKQGIEMNSTVRKRRRMAHGKSRVVEARKRPGPVISPISGQALHGVPHATTARQRKRLSKTAKRPSAPFGGVLTANERETVFQWAAAVEAGQAPLESVDARYRPFVKKALGRFA
jgi:ribosomal protein L34E